MKAIIITATVLACIITVIMVGYRQYNKPHRSAAMESPIIISAATLAASYQKDEAGSDKKYLGKTLQVSGTVSEWSANPQGLPLVLLAGNGTCGVQCTLLSQEQNMQKGDSLTLKGFCNGFLEDVVLDQCIIVLLHSRQSH